MEADRMYGKAGSDKTVHLACSLQKVHEPERILEFFANSTLD